MSAQRRTELMFQHFSHFTSLIRLIHSYAPRSIISSLHVMSNIWFMNLFMHMLPLRAWATAALGGCLHDATNRQDQIRILSAGEFPSNCKASQLCLCQSKYRNWTQGSLSCSSTYVRVSAFKAFRIVFHESHLSIVCIYAIFDFCISIIVFTKSRHRKPTWWLPVKSNHDRSLEVMG